VVGAIVACLLLIGVAVRAASSISGERDRLTWDSLLASPLESSAILFGKWLGSLLSVRWGWLWLGVIWGQGSALGGLHLLALPLLVLAWLVYAGLLATVGLWFSLVCATSSRAMVWTLFTILALAAGFLALPLYTSILIQTPSSSVPWVDWLNHFEMGITPPIVLGRLLPFGWERDMPGFGTKQEWETAFAFGGLLCWVIAAAIVWVVMTRRFRRMTGRCPVAPLLSTQPQPVPPE
jgi:ABC-type transport system involved in multi-copper enzyme maturation permease subunit